MSILYCGSSSRPLGRTAVSTGLFAGQIEQLIARAHQPVVADTGPVLQHDVEAGGVAQLEDRRRRERDDRGVLVVGEARHDAAGDRLHVVLLARPLVPVLEREEGEAGVLAASAEAESVDLEDRADAGLLLVEHIVADGGERLFGSDAGGARRRFDLDEHDALVFVGQEPRRDPDEQQGQRRDDDAVDQHGSARSVRASAARPPRSRGCWRRRCG